MHPEDRPRIVAQVGDVVRTSHDWVSEFRLLMPDGSVKHAHVTASAVRNSRGEREYVGAIMDVTERKRAQEAEGLALANDRLERALRGSNVGIWGLQRRRDATRWRFNVFGEPVGSRWATSTIEMMTSFITCAATHRTANSYSSPPRPCCKATRASSRSRRA